MSVKINEEIKKWVEETAALTKPDRIIWIDGSEEQLAELRREALSTGELIKLNEEKLPGCYLHRSDPGDVARVEDRTFICTPTAEEVGPTNHWKDPSEMREMLTEIMSGSMVGRDMYVIPYSMGTIGSPFAKYGIELSDSIYVVVNMSIMTRVSDEVYAAIDNCGGEYVKGIHCKDKLDPEKRYITHFPQDNTIISVNSGYGGNVLLGKKCFSLRIASYQARNENWLAEHMLILGIESPDGDVSYIAAAFPSACGKTNLAMLIPPEVYQEKGYKVWCVGDDIAWLRIGEDGRLWATNPENGFFGVAPGTSEKTNYNALMSTRNNSIFTNVAMTEEGTVWWEGLDKNPPANLTDWKGNPWTPDSGVKAAHPNSRFTAPAKNCPCISPEFESPKGVPISAIVFGGRRAKTAPLVYQARNWKHGVFVGSIMASETTAAAIGQVGVVRRDPMAMLPFCGYNMGDYWAHWLDMGKLIENPPEIFNVNWFRTDDEGNFLWPGFGENMRVLEWILNRCHGKVGAKETEIGYMPNASDINLEGIDMDEAGLEDLLTVDKSLWDHETHGIREYYQTIGSSVPEQLHRELHKLENALNAI